MAREDWSVLDQDIGIRRGPTEMRAALNAIPQDSQYGRTARQEENALAERYDESVAGFIARRMGPLRPGQAGVRHGGGDRALVLCGPEDACAATDSKYWSGDARRRSTRGVAVLTCCSRKCAMPSSAGVLWMMAALPAGPGAIAGEAAPGTTPGRRATPWCTVKFYGALEGEKDVTARRARGRGGNAEKARVAMIAAEGINTQYLEEVDLHSQRGIAATGAPAPRLEPPHER